MIQTTYTDYVQDILDSINEIEEFVRGIAFEEFIKDKKTLNAVLRSLEIMGEAAKKIPENIRSQYPSVPWRKMTGMRDKLIHEYSGVDTEIVWQTIKKDLPKVKPLIKQIKQEMG